jgi:phage-related minor tail protein
VLEYELHDSVTLNSQMRQINYKQKGKMNSSEFKVKGEDLIRKIREIIAEGNVNRIIIKDDKGKVYLEIPVTLGVIGALVAPVLAAVGALAAFAADFTIEVIRKD